MLGHCSLQSLALSAATTLLMGVSFASGSNALEVGPHQHSPRWQPIHHARAGLSKRASRHRKRKCSARSTSSSVDTGLAGTNLTVSTGSKVHPIAASGSTSASPSKSTKSVHKSRTPLYDWTDYSNTAYGVNLGSWLMLERWMALDLFNTNAPNAVDDYTFAQALGDRTAAVLKPYWESWVKDADIDRIAATGANMIRIPVGYWAFHENVFDDPFPALQGQQAQITRVMKRIAKHGMYAIIDLHSMPGRASTDQCNGRLNGPVQFYDPEFQPYNDAVIRAVYKYITKSPYRNNIAAIGALNEPDACVSSRNETRIAALGDFYQRSYDFLAKQKDRVPLIVHHGYCGLPQWNSFVSDKDPNYLIMEDHPYPGTFASTNGDADALGGVCYKAQEYSQYAVPVVVTEWTLRLKTGGPDLVPKMFAQQVSAYAASGGSVFWSHKGDNDADDGWNYLKLVENGTIQVPSNGTSLMDWAKGLGGTCTGLSTPPWAK